MTFFQKKRQNFFFPFQTLIFTKAEQSIQRRQTMPIPSCRPEVEGHKKKKPPALHSLTVINKVVVPKDEPIWSWLFDSRHSAVTGLNSIKGFRDPASGEFISYTDARTLSTYLSTSFARDFQVAAGDCISIFCNNSVWYPVALFAAFRLGLSGISSLLLAFALPVSSLTIAHRCRGCCCLTGIHQE